MRSEVIENIIELYTSTELTCREIAELNGLCSDTVTKYLKNNNIAMKPRPRGIDSPFFVGFGEISQWYWKSIKAGAISRNLDFDIKIEYCWDLFLKQNRSCALTGLPLSFAYGDSKSRQTASLDRIDSSLGYIEGNIQWAHKVVNMMRKNIDVTHFVNLCRMVVAFNER